MREPVNERNGTQPLLVAGTTTRKNGETIEYCIRGSAHPKDPTQMILMPEIKIRTAGYDKPRHLLFIVDVSGSMGTSIFALQNVLTQQVVTHANAHDYISLVSFNNNYLVHINNKQFFTIQNHFFKIVRELRAGGSTAMDKPLLNIGLAHHDAPDARIDASENSVIFLLTDGDSYPYFLSEHEKIYNSPHTIDPITIINTIKQNCKLDFPIPIVTIGLGNYKRAPLKYLSFLSGIGHSAMQVEIHIENGNKESLQKGFEKTEYFMSNPLQKHDEVFTLALESNYNQLSLEKLWFEGRPKIAFLNCKRTDNKAATLSFCIKKENVEQAENLLEACVDLKNLACDYDVIAQYAEKQLAEVLFKLEYELEKKLCIKRSVNNLYKILDLFDPYDKACESRLAQTIVFNIISLIEKMPVFKPDFIHSDAAKYMHLIKTLSSDAALNQSTGAYLHAGKKSSNHAASKPDNMINAFASCGPTLPETEHKDMKMEPKKDGTIWLPLNFGHNLSIIKETKLLCAPTSTMLQNPMKRDKFLLIDTESPKLAEQINRIRRSITRAEPHPEAILSLCVKHYIQYFVKSLPNKATFLKKLEEPTNAGCISLENMINEKALFVSDDFSLYINPLIAVTLAALIKSKELRPGSVRLWTPAYPGMEGLMYSHSFVTFHPEGVKNIYLVDFTLQNDTIHDLSVNSVIKELIQKYKQKNMPGILNQCLFQYGILETMLKLAKYDSSIDLAVPPHLIELADPEGDKAPPELQCPIARAGAMLKPVTIEGQPDKHVFDKDSIEEWISLGKKTNPLTNQPMSIPVKLIPAVDTIENISAFVRQQCKAPIPHFAQVIIEPYIGSVEDPEGAFTSQDIVMKRARKCHEAIIRRMNNDPNAVRDFVANAMNNYYKNLEVVQKSDEALNQKARYNKEQNGLPVATTTSTNCSSITPDGLSYQESFNQRGVRPDISDTDLLAIPYQESFYLPQALRYRRTALESKPFQDEVTLLLEKGLSLPKIPDKFLSHPVESEPQNTMPTNTFFTSTSEYDYIRASSLGLIDLATINTTSLQNNWICASWKELRELATIHEELLFYCQEAKNFCVKCNDIYINGTLRLWNSTSENVYYFHHEIDRTNAHIGIYIIGLFISIIEKNCSSDTKNSFCPSKEAILSIHIELNKKEQDVSKKIEETQNQLQQPKYMRCRKEYPSKRGTDPDKQFLERLLSTLLDYQQKILQAKDIFRTYTQKFGLNASSAFFRSPTSVVITDQKTEERLESPQGPANPM